MAGFEVERSKFNSSLLKDLVKELKPALVIFDPLQAFIPSDIQMGQRNAMRNCLNPLIGLGEHELFSVEDVMEITGESRETIMERIEQCRQELTAAGENADDYFMQMEPAEKTTLFFPGGASDFKS